jgi:hypothetical protein
MLPPLDLSKHSIFFALAFESAQGIINAFTVAQFNKYHF